MVTMVTHGYPHVICSFFAGSRSWVNIGAQKKRDGGVLCSNPQKDRTNREIYSRMFGEYIFYTIQEKLFYPCQELRYRLYLNTQILHLRMSSRLLVDRYLMVCRIMIMIFFLIPLILVSFLVSTIQL